MRPRWNAAALEAITATKKGQHGGRGARAVPFARRQQVEAEPEEPRSLGRRAARRLELRQRDFDPAMGGHGWTEHCPKCDRARVDGWQKAIQMQHSDACRTRIELALQQTERGKERLEHAKLKSECLETFERVKHHLADNHVDLQSARIQFGAPLTVDGKAETFMGDMSGKANPLLTREYRKGFEVPASAQSV